MWLHLFPAIAHCCVQWTTPSAITTHVNTHISLVFHAPAIFITKAGRTKRILPNTHKWIFPSCFFTRIKDNDETLTTHWPIKWSDGSASVLLQAHQTNIHTQIIKITWVSWREDLTCYSVQSECLLWCYQKVKMHVEPSNGPQALECSHLWIQWTV